MIKKYLILLSLGCLQAMQHSFVPISPRSEDSTSIADELRALTLSPSPATMRRLCITPRARDIIYLTILKYQSVKDMVNRGRLSRLVGFKRIAKNNCQQFVLAHWTSSDRGRSPMGYTPNKYSRLDGNKLGFKLKAAEAEDLNKDFNRTIANYFSGFKDIDIIPLECKLALLSKQQVLGIVLNGLAERVEGFKLLEKHNLPQSASPRLLEQYALVDGKIGEIVNISNDASLEAAFTAGKKCWRQAMSHLETDNLVYGEIEV